MVNTVEGKARSQGEKEGEGRTRSMGCHVQDQEAIKEVSGVRMLTGKAETNFNLNQKQIYRELPKSVLHPTPGRPIFQLNTEEYALTKQKWVFCQKDELIDII